MRIGIDCNLINRGGGISTMITSIINNISADTKNEYYLFFCSKKAYIKIPNSINYKKVYIYDFWFLFWEQFLIPLLAYFYKIDILHSPGNSGPIIMQKKIKHVVTIHDVIYMKGKRELLNMTNWYQFLGRLYLSFVVPIVASKCSAIITVSKSSMLDINMNINNVNSKLHLIYEAGDSLYDKKLNNFSSIHILKKYNISTKFFIALGAVDPRKNTLKIIHAFLNLNDRNLLNQHSLVITSTSKDFFKLLFKSVKKLPNNIIFLPYIPKSDLVSLFHSAEFFIYPSTYEGFGLPVLDAKLALLPVLTSNQGSLPEVGGSSVYYLDPFSLKSIEDGIVKFCKNKFSTELDINAAYSHAKEFSWSKNFTEHIKVYESL
jgi:glycosyltransferase involved in cell wall biosynthesis